MPDTDTPQRGRGRPRKADALTPAERMARLRARASDALCASGAELGDIPQTALFTALGKALNPSAPQVETAGTLVGELFKRAGSIVTVTEIDSATVAVNQAEDRAQGIADAGELARLRERVGELEAELARLKTEPPTPQPASEKPRAKQSVSNSARYPLSIKARAVAMQREGRTTAEIVAMIDQACGYSPDTTNLARTLKGWSGRADVGALLPTLDSETFL